ncbi:MAG: PfkB family carbohydrate kinase [Candidatus Paceibacterota bacterium]
MKSITLIATKTVDHINNLDKAVKLVRSGGPALYCKEALNALGCKVCLLTPKNPVTVHIIIKDQHEKIRIKRVGKIMLPKRLFSRNILLSPILGEFNLEQLSERDCCIFLDAQGYIRVKGENLVHFWDCCPKDLKNVVALKVNQRESKYVPKKVIKLFQSRILLITHGQKGVEIWHHGRQDFVKSNPIEAKDTLGAGDTFFGSFVALFIQSNNALLATEIAVRKAEELLQRK